MAVRLVCDLTAREHTNTYFKELNILKFSHLAEAKIEIFMFKAWNCELPDSAQCLLYTTFVNRYQARKLSNIQCKCCKSKLKSYCLSILGIRLWNEVEQNMKNCCSMPKFLKRESQFNFVFKTILMWCLLTL